MSTANLKTRLARLEVATPATEFSMDDLTAICKRLGSVDLDSQVGSPALLAVKRELKDLLQKMALV